MTSSATIMVAPNGARKTKSDHPEVPMTIAETAQTAAACAEAGATAIHAHIRDAQGAHILDAAVYRELLDAITRECGDKIFAQVTTEAVGIYQPEEQMAVMRELRPRGFSAALKELIASPEKETEAADFYHWALKEDIAVQHILYAAEEIHRFADLVRREVIPGGRHALLFVLGRYAKNLESEVEDLLPFIEALNASGLKSSSEWMVCGFGRSETASLAAAMALGGHARVGFENSLWHADGEIAESNAERVHVISAIAEHLGRGGQTLEDTSRVLGVRDTENS
ncbi:3-keto-5-aminohexanoate cleavage protein [Denitrobaculum tricleocarpae]|uniref:3-keto-5-aminohexanoate cleavage protein n=1 Tax=Denitrobaculum tricleocarpae TaxID=2591009 RepID=A0A545TYK9_9PROT|nr:3-keto-5-aminohexanoate cleavage protein [Denitrobaculum tricleocarpae]TQV82263.1 3-keto-5-aminohexanoate cleavage protein [Denitrobaculum tricleocarpae]